MPSRPVDPASTSMASTADETLSVHDVHVPDADSPSTGLPLISSYAIAAPSSYSSDTPDRFIIPTAYELFVCPPRRSSRFPEPNGILPTFSTYVTVH